MAEVRPHKGATWVPNQHGAWAMLAGPLLVGVVAGGAAWVHLPLTLLWFLGYFAFFAAGLWLKSRRKARFRPPVLVYSLACVPLGIVVLVLEPSLVRWVPSLAPLMVIALVLAAERRDRSLPSGIATTLAASLMTVVAYDAGPGSDWDRAWLLTAVMAGYYLGVLLYVKTMIRERGHASYVVASVAWHALCTVGAAFVSWPLALVGLVLTARAWAAPRTGLTPKQVGIGEIVLNTLVVVVALLTV
jgi:hypothetical protein